MSKIYCASDHAGYLLKKKLCTYYKDWVDLGCDSEEPVDYPNFAHKAVKKIQEDHYNRAVLICGTGIGMSIAANRFKGVRAMVATQSDFVTLARQHNDINVLCLAGRFINEAQAKDFISFFLNTPFKDEHHTHRISLLDAFL